MTKLSDHFTLAELCVSDTAKRLGIPNAPTVAHLNNMQRWLAPGLEAVRKLCGGKTVTVHSAYRNPRVNAAVGGTPTSAHPMGLAADITVAGMTPLAVARTVARAMKRRELQVDQLILESGRGVVHVSFDGRARMQMGHQPGKAGSAIDWAYFADVAK